MASPRAQDGERRVAADPWDVDGWQILALQAERSPFCNAKPVYEKLVTQFPPCGRFWRVYAEHLARDNSPDHDAIMAIYNRGVSQAPTSLELWRSFVTYATSQAVKAVTSQSTSVALEVLERAVTAAGLDLSANTLWSHYIEFVADRATLSDGQRRDILRRLYQRAVRTPMQNLDTFWRNYSVFESSTQSNKEVARTILAEWQPKNVEARAEFRARRARREGLTLTSLPVPPRYRAKESSQAQQWRRFIAFERTNPNSHPIAERHTRVVHAFETALAPLYRYPDLWMEYLAYVYSTFAEGAEQPSQKANSKDSAAQQNDAALNKMATAVEPLLERAVAALPESIALHVYVNSLYVRIGKASKGVSVLEKLCTTHPSALAYVHLMRTVRKCDGRDAARKVFSKARKDSKAATPYVYIAAAQMEFAVNRDNKVARNVFEFGLKNFPKNAVMTLEYVNWLWGVGDMEYARVVMKKVMPDVTGTTEEVRSLWERWLELEDTVGDAASVDQVTALWNESGVGRTNSVVQDAIRMSRFLGMEGLREEEMAQLDGKVANSGESTTNNNSSTGGKRDPRTGRRVGTGGSGKDNGAQSTQRRGVGDSAGAGSIMKTGKEWLMRMAASLPPIAMPPPTPGNIQVILHMVMDTPDDFSETPAGRSSALAPRDEDHGPPLNGKKRKSDELLHGSMGLPNLSAPTAKSQDVFRARQAAKHSRLR